MFDKRLNTPTGRDLAHRCIGEESAVDFSGGALDRAMAREEFA